MAVQYYSANYVNPDTGERGIWYYSDRSVESAAEIVAAGGGTYRYVEGDLPDMSGPEPDLTTEEFRQRYRNDYPSVAITPEGLAEPAPAIWPKERILPDAEERLEYIKEFEVMLGIGVAAEITAPVTLGVLTSITDVFNSIGSWFFEIYLEVYGWVWPFWMVADLFYKLAELFISLAGHFQNVWGIIEIIVRRINELLDWDTIQSYLLGYVPNLEDIRDWFYYWTFYVGGEITSWWTSTMVEVQGWIDIATEGIDTLRASWSSFWNITFPQWTSSLDTLRADWDNFWTVTVPTFVSQFDLDTWWQSRLTDLDNLMNTKLRDWFPFYDDLTQLWDSIAEFFVDPFDWIKSHVIEPIIDDFNKGFDRGMSGEEK